MTGTAVSQRSWPSQQAATALAQRLAPLADWTADERQLCACLDQDGNGSAGRVRQTADTLAAELGLTARRDQPLAADRTRLSQLPHDRAQASQPPQSRTPAHAGDTETAS
ncbi:MAG: hypothetical protein ACRDZO_05195 [Egibacteraceae bacterium]